MTVGFELYDDSGNLMLSNSDYTHRYLGQIEISQADAANLSGASMSVPEFATGRPVTFFMPSYGDGMLFLEIKINIRITISGTTLSWDWPPVPGWEGILKQGLAGTLFYGIS